MPTSTLLQLVVRGRQDMYLTSNPQFTFFKHVYRRYTPFAMESIPIDMDGNADFGQRISAIIPAYGDLLSSLYVEIDLPAIPQPDPNSPTYYWVNDTACALIKDVSIEIGDQEFDKHTGEWLNIWAELTVPQNKRDGYNEMVGHWNIYPPSSDDATSSLSLSIPLRFWFCNTIGAALPMIALQVHPVRIIFHLRSFQEMWWSAALPCGPGQPSPALQALTISRFQLFGDYIYLDKDERRRFAAAEHEYLIDQLQISPVQAVSAGIAQVQMPLYFNHCTKEFVWVVQETRMAAAREWFNYSSALQSNGGEPVVPIEDLLGTAQLKLDGYDRFYIRNAKYFRLTQPYKYHTNVPAPPVYIYLYSFSLDPEGEQPAGSINLSKIDDVIMSLVFNPNELGQDRAVQMYATNYNVLRIIGGMGGLAFIA